MNNVSKIGEREWHRMLNAGLLILLGVVIVGCATTEPKQLQPTAVSAVAKSGNTYVVRRAAVRTASTVRLQHQRAQQQQRPIQRRPVANARRPVQPRRFPGQLSKAQYHARYQAQKRAEAKAAAERRRARQEAIRQGYVSKWQQKQQKRLAHNKNWQQEQLAKQRRAQIAARKAELQRKLAARKPVVRKKANRPAQSTKVVRAAVRKPVAQKKAWARKPKLVPPRRPVAVQKQKRPDPRAKYLARWERMQAEKRLEAKRAEQRVERVIQSAKQQIGRKYVWGGASPKQGFDCSGLVQHSINKGANVSVPRTALQQYQASVKVPAHKAERGDLVFFITRGKRVSHVGIYLGDNKFVHAPRTGRTVTKDRIKGYWKKRLVGFGRIPGACRIPMPKA